MKSSASFRISPKSSTLSAKISGEVNTRSSSGIPINGISPNSSPSESQTCHNFVPVSPEYIHQPLEDFDSPQTNVSQTNSLNIGIKKV